MKKNLKNLLFISSAALLMLASCKKNDNTVVNSGSKSSALTANTTTLVLDKTNLADTNSVVMFNFTAPKYNYKAVVANSLQIDAAGDNWKNPTTAPLGQSGSHGYTTAAFNSLLLKLNLPAGQASQVNVRVVNALSNVVASYSNVVTMTVTPFNLTSFLYAVGNFEGWSLPNVDSLVSPTSNGIYTGIINFPAGKLDFLILPQSNSYDNKYATTDPVTGVSSTVTIGANNNLFAPAAGYYLVTLNINNKTISFEAVHSYSLIGNTTPGTAWSTDTQLKYVNDGNNTWAIKGVAMTMGLAPNNGFKVRQDDAWDKSWGTLSTPDGITLTDDGGVNISSPTAGNYNFTFVMSPVAISADPPVTVEYTLIKQ